MSMMSLEQAIASYEKSAERYHKALLYCKAHGGEFYQEEAESNKTCYEHDRQLAAWLRELKERRKEPVIPLSWIEKHIERLNNEDNAFAELTANIINAMIVVWNNEQKGEPNERF